MMYLLFNSGTILLIFDKCQKLLVQQELQLQQEISKRPTYSRECFILELKTSNITQLHPNVNVEYL